jgi:hypothetical protein
MPWYYAGPEAKPVGPLSLDELHARRVSGAISPETYVIEHTGLPNEVRAWKRYREVFSYAPVPLPPAPVVAGSPLPPPPAPVITPPAVPHPLFPSAAVIPGAPPQPYALPTHASPIHNDPYYTSHRTNSMCAWGFGLGLASPFCVFCVIGVFMAIASVACCIMGLTQLQKHREQTGRGLALMGLAGSALAFILTLALLVAVGKSALSHHPFTITEQTSNDSE